MLGCNRTILLCTQTVTFCSTLGQGQGEEGKKEVEKATFPTLLMMIVALNNSAQRLFSVDNSLQNNHVICGVNLIKDQSIISFAIILLSLMTY